MNKAEISSDKFILNGQDISDAVLLDGFKIEKIGNKYFVNCKLFLDEIDIKNMIDITTSDDAGQVFILTEEDE